MTSWPLETPSTRRMELPLEIENEPTPLKLVNDGSASTRLAAPSAPVVVLNVPPTMPVPSVPPTSR